VQDLKKTNTALKTGLIFPTGDGGYSIEETAASIAEQRPDQVTNPAELLLWLVEVRSPPVVNKSIYREFAKGVRKVICQHWVCLYVAGIVFGVQLLGR
jgi:hypothetical protein